MEVTHETLVEAAKTWGLFYLMGFSICVIVYAFWPANRERFDRAKRGILDEDDQPWT